LTGALPLPDLHAGNGSFHLFNRDFSQLLRESPDVTIRVHDPVGAVAVELVGRLLDLFCLQPHAPVRSACRYHPPDEL
jgi:hypothetical protein